MRGIVKKHVWITILIDQCGSCVVVIVCDLDIASQGNSRVVPDYFGCLPDYVLIHKVNFETRFLVAWG